MKELRGAGVAVYAIYEQISLTNGLKQMEKYFGTRPDMYSNKTDLQFEFAPLKILVRLKDMKIMLVESTKNGEPVVFTTQEAIEACKKL